MRAHPASGPREWNTRSATPCPMELKPITDREFAQFQRLIHQIAGISLSPAKKAMVCGRLAKRVRELGLDSYGDYLQRLAGRHAQDELQTAVDLLTTNETFFFREKKHFEFLARHVQAARRPGLMFRAWSAACSSGEEPYSIAMVLAECLGDGPWEVVASDISRRVLARGQGGCYAMERAEHIPTQYLRRYCLRGIGSKTDTFLIERFLRDRVRFVPINLNAALGNIGPFDVVFLRNVMIYFDMTTKQQVVARVAATLRSGGIFIVSHSETLHGISDALEQIVPSVYRKP